MKKIKRMQMNAQNLQSYIRLYVSDREAYSVIKKVRAEKLTYLNSAALSDLYERIRQIEREDVNGILVEAGCALGGSSLVMATAKQKNRPFFIYDAFEMIPSPSEADGLDAHTRYEQIVSGQAKGIKGEAYYGYQPDLLKRVQQTFYGFGFSPAEQNIHFIKGYYEDVLYIDAPVALAHLDCDWHDSVMICLQRIEPHLVRGGVLVIDDYNDWSGCKKAVDTYFTGRENQFKFEMKSRLHIIRK